MSDHTGKNTLSGDAKKGTSLITVNFKDGAVINRVQLGDDNGVPKFLRKMAGHASKSKVKSVIVMTIDEDNYVDWSHMADSDHHLALAALCLDDLKEELKAVVFPDGDE